MAPEDTYVRRVCAVLLADVTGFSAMMGEDEEGTARAIKRLNVLVQGIVADVGGRAEASAGDAIFATFDSVVAAVDVAIQVQRRLLGPEFGPPSLRIRIGVHVGDVLLHEGGAFGDAINIGARLQALARPGTICVSDAVYRQVRTKFDTRFEDLGHQRLKNISDPVHAYLIVPEAPAGKLVRRRKLSPWLVGGAAAAAGALALLVAYESFDGRWAADRAPGGPPALDGQAGGASAGARAEKVAATSAPVALGVMLFKSHGDEGESGWMPEALREGLNARSNR
jgi:class 3 adenylate cyclase